MRKYKKMLLSLLTGLSLLSGVAVSKDVALEAIKTFPVAKELLTMTGDPVSVIETGTITGENGLPARGPHEITFNLDASSKYPVIVDGVKVQPGNSLVIVRNLTTTGHTLSIPIYPAVDGIEGVANYTMTLPVIRTQVCSEGATELEDGCLTITTSDMTINCPDTYSPDTSNGVTCLNYSVNPIILECEEGYGLEGGECVRRTILTAGYNCNAFPGTTLNGDACVQYEVKPVSQCLSGWDVFNGQCRLEVDNIPANESCPSGYTRVGSSCQEVAKKPPTGYSCSSGYVKANDGCYEKVDFIFDPEYVCPFGYTKGKWDQPGYCTDSDAFILPLFYDTWESAKEYCDERDGTLRHDATPNHFICNLRTPYRTSVPLICPAVLEGVAGQGGVCYNSTKSGSKTYRCNTGYSYNGIECTRTYTSLLIQNCPDTYELNDNRCHKYSYDQLGNYCLLGGDYNASNNNCEININTPAQRHCNPDFTIDNNGESCKKEEKYNFVNCNDSSYKPDEVMSKCERTLFEQPTLICDDGFESHEAELKCVKTSKTDFVL